EIQDIDGHLEQIVALLKQHGFTLVVEQEQLLKATHIYNIYAVHPTRRLIVDKPSATHEQVPPRQETNWNSEQVAHWQALYDETYQLLPPLPDPTRDIHGWNSSFTGLPIPADQMHVWVDQTVARIRALHPAAALEIGCGTGLLLFRIAPACRTYL